ncbi:MAG: hypothetical protein R3B49_11665 [Phycisphaerales bacterium]
MDTVAVILIAYYYAHRDQAPRRPAGVDAADDVHRDGVRVQAIAAADTIPFYVFTPMMVDISGCRRRRTRTRRRGAAVEAGVG